MQQIGHAHRQKAQELVAFLVAEAVKSYADLQQLQRVEFTGARSVRQSQGVKGAQESRDSFLVWHKTPYTCCHRLLNGGGSLRPLYLDLVKWTGARRLDLARRSADRAARNSSPCFLRLSSVLTSLAKRAGQMGAGGEFKSGKNFFAGGDPANHGAPLQNENFLPALAR